MNYDRDAKKRLRQQRKAKAAERRSAPPANPQKPAPAGNDSPPASSRDSRDGLLLPRFWREPNVARRLYALSHADLLRLFIEPATVALREALDEHELTILQAKIAAQTSEEEAVDTRYRVTMRALVTAVRKHQDRARAGRRRIVSDISHAGQRTEVLFDSVCAAIFWEAFLACRALWGQYRDMLRWSEQHGGATHPMLPEHQQVGPSLRLLTQALRLRVEAKSSHHAPSNHHP